jgi:hypothetical protein
MSNVITGNPIILDTAAATVVTSTPFWVSTIKWTVDAAATDNDSVVLKDKNGIVKYEEILTVVTSGMTQAPPITFNPPLFFDGLICSTLDGGKVYIYLAKNNNLV